MVHQAKADIGEVLQPRVLQRAYKLIHWTNRDLSVGSAVDEEQWRNRFDDITGGRSFSDTLSQRFLRAGKEFRDHFCKAAIFWFLPIQIDGTRITDNGLDHAGPVLVRSITLQAVRLVHHGEKQRKMSTGRIAIGADTVYVNVVLLGMRAQPADRAFAILQGGRERRFAG